MPCPVATMESPNRRYRDGARFKWVVALAEARPKIYCCGNRCGSFLSEDGVT